MKFDVEPLHRELLFNSQVWDKVPYRTNFDKSPHREVNDIWVRYNALENLLVNPKTFNDEHISIWYPVVAELPSARLLALELSQLVEADRLGGVLITKVPPKCQVYPHVDGGWHAKFYEKFVIQVRGNDRQAFCFEGERLSASNGECYWFNNQSPHWVTNESEEDRISLIVCVRREQCRFS